MICRHCGKTVSEDATFCPYCGGQIELTCPHCKTHLEDDMAFCPKCGKKTHVAVQQPQKKISSTKKTETIFFYIKHGLLVLLGLYMTISIFLPWINLSGYADNIISYYEINLNFVNALDFINQLASINSQLDQIQKISSGVIISVIIPLCITLITQLVIFGIGIAFLVIGIISVSTRKVTSLKLVKKLILISLGFIIVSGILNGGLFGGGTFIFIVAILILTFWQIHEKVLFKGKKIKDIILEGVQHAVTIIFIIFLVSQLNFVVNVYNSIYGSRIDSIVNVRGLDFFYSAVEDLAMFLKISENPQQYSNQIITLYNEMLPDTIVQLSAFIMFFISNILWVIFAISELNNFGETKKRNTIALNSTAGFFFWVFFILIYISFPVFFYEKNAEKILLYWFNGVALQMLSIAICIFQTFRLKREKLKAKQETINN
jgi:RNA polymerase subunit RPABC4/transcription elongation factor Spt4